jgi:hypothetical protein
VFARSSGVIARRQRHGGARKNIEQIGEPARSLRQLAQTGPEAPVETAEADVKSIAQGRARERVSRNESGVGGWSGGHAGSEWPVIKT